MLSKITSRIQNSASDSKLRHSVNHSQTSPPSTSDNKHSQTTRPISKKKKKKNETVEGLEGEMKDTS